MIKVFDIPEHWEEVPFWSLFTRVKRTGFQDEELLSVYRDYGVIPKSSRDDNHNVASEDLSGYQLVQPGDLVVNKMKAWQGSFAISEHRGIVSPAYFVYKPHHNCDQRFLHYLLRSAPYMAHYNKISSGVRIGQWDLDPGQLRLTQVGIPPLEEQRAIANYLDSEIEAIQTLTQSILTLKRIHSERLTTFLSGKLLGGGQITNHSSKNATEFITGLSEGWIATKLKFLLLRNDGGTWGEEPTEDGRDQIVLRSTEQTNLGDWRIEEPALRSISESEHKRTRLLKGDLLLTKSSGSEAHIGKCTLVNQEIADMNASFSNFMQRLRVNSSKVLPEYVWLYLNSSICRIQYVLNSNSTIGLGNLNSTVLGDLAIPIPPIEVQQELVSAMQKTVNSSRSLIEASDAILGVTQERLSSVISNAVLGKGFVNGRVNG